MSLYDINLYDLNKMLQIRCLETPECIPSVPGGPNECMNIQHKLATGQPVIDQRALRYFKENGITNDHYAKFLSKEEWSKKDNNLLLDGMLDAIAGYFQGKRAGVLGGSRRRRKSLKRKPSLNKSKRKKTKRKKTKRKKSKRKKTKRRRN